MDISYTKEQEEFRKEVRAWLRETVPLVKQNDPSLDRFENKVKINLEWEKKLYEGGYAGLSWPKELGGQGKDSFLQIIFKEECGKIDAPTGVNVIGNNILGPTLLEIGTKEQKERYIPKILAGEEIWCQGFSEPNAGSDLANINSTARLEGDKWIINGQKTWASWSQYAQHCILLARTEPGSKKHQGITFFLVPMDLEGITVRPLVTMNDEREFSEIFFDDVELDKDLVLGEVNDGWRVAMRALSFERGTNALEKQARFYRELTDLISLMKSDDKLKELLTNPYYEQKIAKTYSDLEVLRYLGLQIIDKLQRGEKITSESSLQKLFWSEYHKRFGELAMEILGENSLYWKEDGYLNGKYQDIFLHSRAETIYAGTSEIQRNIIAERILEMPR